MLRLQQLCSFRERAGGFYQSAASHRAADAQADGRHLDWSLVGMPEGIEKALPNLPHVEVADALPQ